MAERGTAWLTEPEQRSWRALINVTTGVLSVLDAELRAEHGLSLGEYEVLARLSEEPEHSLRMTDLAGRLRLSPSGITRRIDGLVRAGLVERRQCPSDRRGSNAVLTDTGMRRLREAAPAHVRGVRSAGDLAITWIRRTRTGGDSWDAVEVPLAEESERYEIDILDGTTVKRTLSATTPAATYTAADQTTDFGAPQSSIAVRVSQLSTTFGRGTPRAATL